MDATSLYTVLITAITVLGSASAWRYYEKRALRKEKSEDYMKDECRERIAKLEVLLEKSSSDKDELRSKILELTKEVTELRIKVEFLEEKNRELQKKANSTTTKNPTTITATKKPTTNPTTSNRGRPRKN
jgi:chromosome segregation ATPase